MISYSIIQKSQLEGALRLDAEYYQPEYLKIRENIKNIGFFNFGDIITAFGSGKNLPQTDNASFIKFVRTQNVRPIIIDDNGMSFTQQKNYPKLNYGDLLFVRVGEGVGNSSVVTKNFQDTTFSDNVIRIRIKNVNPFYVSVLLNSKIGSLLMEQIKKGSARSLISRENLNSLRIPKIIQEQQIYFEDIVNQSEKLIIESEKIYSQAENLLLEELGIKDFEIDDDLSYIVNLSEIKSAHRADAEYFQPKYEKLIKRMKEKVEMQELKTIATTRRGSLIDPRFYDDTEGTPYIRGKDFSSGRLEKSGLVYISRDFRPKNEIKVNSGDLVFALIGSVGTSALVSEEFNNSFISNNTGKISIKNKKEILPEYLAIVLNSIVGKLQFEKEVTRTAQPKISDPQVRNFYIPILPKSTQQKIADLVQKSHEARKKAKELLEEAKQKVENAIENEINK